MMLVLLFSLYLHMFVYGLSSSANPELIRYIGYTTKPLKERLRGHKDDCNNAKKKNHKATWGRKVILEGYKIIITEIDQGLTIAELLAKEKHYIKLYSSFGAKLVNSTTGGEEPTVIKGGTIEFNKRTKSKTVYCFDVATKSLVHTAYSAEEMGRILSIAGSMINRIARGGVGKVYKNYTFSYEPVFIEYVPLIKKKSGQTSWCKGQNIRNIVKYHTRTITIDKDGKQITFESITDCAAYFNANRSVISTAAKKGKYRGYKLSLGELPVGYKIRQEKLKIKHN